MAALRPSQALRVATKSLQITRVASRTYIVPSTRFVRAQPLTIAPLHVRRKTVKTNDWASKPIIEYSELKPLTEQPTDDVLVVDVREPDEVVLGSIPSSVNLPMSELATALKSNYDASEFRRKYLFDKPNFKQNIVFYCRSGKRAATAAEIAQQEGYKNVRNYKGSWLEWSKREGTGSEDD